MTKTLSLVALVAVWAHPAFANQIVQPEPSGDGALLVLLVLGALYFIGGQAGAAKATRPATETTPAPETGEGAVLMKF